MTCSLCQNAVANPFPLHHQHRFHENCIQEWGQTRLWREMPLSCPDCEYEFPPQQLLSRTQRLWKYLDEDPLPLVSCVFCSIILPAVPGIIISSIKGSTTGVVLFTFCPFIALPIIGGIYYWINRTKQKALSAPVCHHRPALEWKRV